MRPQPSTSSTATLAFAALTIAGCGDASEPTDGDRTLTLGEPTAAFADDFGSVQTVRETLDGRVLVADPLAKALYLVDMDAGTRTPVGSEGEGPDEYLQPDAVWPLPGDSTLLVDLGNGRLVVLGPDFAFGTTMPIAMGEPSMGGGLVLAMPQGIDDHGRVYAQSRGGGLAIEPPDSAAIIRIDRADQSIDTVGTVGLQDVVISRSGPAGRQMIGIQPVPLSPEDAWGVAPDGSIAVARAGDYHVDWIAPDGVLTSGPTVTYGPLPIAMPEKEEWDAQRSRDPQIGISVRISGGAMETSFQRGRRGGGPGGETDLGQFSWPEVLPPIYPGRVPIDAQGRAWVHRHVGAASPPTYDVFDRSGERVGTVELGTDRKIVGFGEGAVYVVAYDAFDLNYLERYTMPDL